MAKSDTRRAANRDSAKRRADEIRRLYSSQAWQVRRRDQLQAFPLCAMCLADGHTTAASIADHNPPHRGNVTAFLENPLQSLCKPCHDRHKQAEEARGWGLQSGPDGWPTDPRHPANTRTASQGGPAAAVSRGRGASSLWAPPSPDRRPSGARISGKLEPRGQKRGGPSQNPPADEGPGTSKADVGPAKTPPKIAKRIDK
jgi:5-methylcytosine-specific restriction protein A